MALLRQKADEISPEELPEMSQKMISFEIDKKLKSRLAQSLVDKRDKARLASLGLAHAGDWLNVIPLACMSDLKSSGTLSSTGWGLPSTPQLAPALPARRRVTDMVTMP